MKDRIRQIMESQHMTQQTFANHIGMSPGSLSSIFNERTRPTLNVVESIKAKFPSINLDWLLFGTGSMYVENEGRSSAENQDGVTPSLPREPVLDFRDSPAPGVFSQSGTHSFQGVRTTPNNYPQNDVNYFDKQKRQITEIRVYFDDQTWESFVPKK